MDTKTKTAAPAARVAENQGALAVYNERSRLPYYEDFKAKFGVDQGQWDALIGSCYPAARTVASVVMVLAYCKARNLDPFKKPVHIVPMYVKGTYDKDPKKRTPGGYVDTVWPGIAEIRTTAHRTHDYAGIDPIELGPMVVTTFAIPASTDEMTGEVTQARSVIVKHPEWASHTVHRLVGGARCAFTGPRVYWLESYASMGKSDIPNEMWRDRPIGQLDKCSEAAALRRAFPEELGNQYAAEEMAGRTIVGDSISGVEIPTIEAKPEPTQPAIEKPKAKTPPPATKGPTPGEKPPFVPPAEKKEAVPNTPSSPQPSADSRPATPPPAGTATGASPSREATDAEVIEEEKRPTPVETSEAATNYAEDIRNAATKQALDAIRKDITEDASLTDEDKMALREPYAKAYERITGKNLAPTKTPPAATQNAAAATAPETSATPGVKDGKVFDVQVFFDWCKGELEKRKESEEAINDFWAEKIEPLTADLAEFLKKAFTELVAFYKQQDT